MRQINSFKISTTRNASDYEFHHQVIDLALKCAIIISAMGKYFNPYKAAFDEFVRLMSITRKNELTQKIADLDDVRDGIIRGLRAAVFGQLKSIIDAQRAAAISVWNTLESRKVQYDTQYVEETGQIDNLLAILLGEQQSAIETLGLLPLVQQLKEVNDLMHQLVDEREHVIGDRYYGSLSKARTATDDAYRLFRDFVNAYWMVNEEQLTEEQATQLLGFMDDVNNIIALYDRVVIKDGTVADKEEIDGEEPTPTNPEGDENTSSDGEQNPSNPTPEDPNPENPGNGEGGENNGSNNGENNGEGGDNGTTNPDDPWYNPDDEPD